MPATLIRPAVLSALPGVFAAFTTRRFAAPDRDAAEAAARQLGAEEGFFDLASSTQVHGNAVAVVDAGGRIPEHDGLVSATPGLLLAVVAADCALVLLADARAGVVGACHAGWRGAVTGIPGETIARMQELGAEAGRMHAYVGPCISLDAFEVGEEVAAQFDDPFVVRRPEWPRPHVDLRAAVAAQLRDAGVPETQTEVSDACTYSEPDRFYSYRGENGTAGRLLGLVGLRA